jgi:ribosomal protein S18 acetylase RimI-like enzyme
MSLPLTFSPLSWDDLKLFLKKESGKISQDVDRDVRYMNFTLYCEETVEGFYLGEELVGFARWDKKVGHLSNLYVMVDARGRGIARRFINARPIRTLYVMPHNHLAKKLYSELGFILSSCAVPTREFMMRQLP